MGVVRDATRHGGSSSQVSTAAHRPSWLFRLLKIASTVCLMAVAQSVFQIRLCPNCGSSGSISFQELQNIIKTTPHPQEAQRSNRYYTSGPHLAGANLSQVVWTQKLWAAHGIHSEIVSYDVYLNRPIGHGLTLLRMRDNVAAAHGREQVNPEILYEASLAEDEIAEDPASYDSRRIPTFHGFSASGNATGQYVYVNYGSYQDFEDLVRADIDLKGKIAVARYGEVWRGMKVIRAQQLGMVAVVIYSDPGEDAFRESDGSRPYPHGYARQPSSVQRGSVLSINWQPGDPSTPGYPSLPGAPRVNPSEMLGLPKIPSLPISYQDAIPLLQALNGHGPLASSLGENWQPGGLEYKGVQYNIGPSPADVVLRLCNDQTYNFAPMHNLIGIINGTEANEVVIIGSHHDSWTLGGAGDPHSSGAAMNEIVRSFGRALEAGWKPRRTLVFASWDGEEYGTLGSVEWVEAFLPWLSDAGVAYLNADPGVSGPVFRVNTAPLLHHVVDRSARNVLSPNQTRPGQTLWDLWTTEVGTLGGGSDWVGFLNHAGIASLDLNFRPGPQSPVYHYHSNFDSITSMENFIDPDFLLHTALAQVWGLIAVELLEKPILPLNATHYATALRAYIEDIQEVYRRSELSSQHKHVLEDLSNAAVVFHNAAVRFDRHIQEVNRAFSNRGRIQRFFRRFWHQSDVPLEVKRINTKLRALERQFLHRDGLDGRPWFKHMVFAPGFWEGYQGVTFPSLRESITKGQEDGLERWVCLIVEAFDRATHLLSS